MVPSVGMTGQSARESLCYLDGAACDAAQLKSFKEALRFESKSLWLPDLLESPDTAFFWDRSRVPWRFKLVAEGAEEVTMRSLYERLGIVATVPVVQVERNAAQGVNAREQGGGFSDAQLAQLTRLVSTVVSTMMAERPNVGLGAGSAAPLAAAAEEASRLAGTVVEETRAHMGPNPSAIFNLGPNFGNVGNSGSHVTFAGQDSGDLADVARALKAAGCSAEEIVRALQSSRQPVHKPTAHAFEWLQATEGTSPLCVYTGLQGETRQSAAIRTINIQTYDAHANKKISLKLSAWPAAQPESVALVKFVELGKAWKEGLVQLNSRLIFITPTLDRGIAPVIPTNVDGFLGSCYTCLTSGTYEPSSVVRAWEAAHFFVVDEYVARRTTPLWEDVWLMPVFQGRLEKAQRVEGVGGLVGGEAYCMSWNSGYGKCGKAPADTCSKLHLCVRCGGSHRVSACSRRE
jgi:hypothetical protein